MTVGMPWPDATRSYGGIDRTTADSLPAARNKSLNTDNTSGEAVSPVLSARTVGGPTTGPPSVATPRAPPDSQFLPDHTVR
jgi:hypothetical protein